MTEERDHEWLLARERGEDVSHVAAATRAPYDEIGELLAKLPGMALHTGWKQRVLAAIDADEARPAASPKPAPAPRRRRWIAGAAVAGLAAAIAIFVVISRGSSRPEPRTSVAELAHLESRIALTAEVRGGTGTPRGQGEEARLGDRYVVRARITGPAELRLYGDTGELLATCTERGGCTVEHDGEGRTLVLEIVLRARGEVRLVAFTGARIPASTGELARDLDAATQAGVAYEARRPIVVH
ncbi:MAG TPA: hypothetical protein VN253_29855 [Kofleriaceae bacterium]|nr:hypothetical protein [Kofleriaceae bacterium]